MEAAAAMTDLQALPEGCIANVLSLTTPRDACRLSSISRDFKSASESDAVWGKFLPPETDEILSHSESSAAIDAKSNKELYIALSDNPILIDGGKMVNYFYPLLIIQCFISFYWTYPSIFL